MEPGTIMLNDTCPVLYVRTGHDDRPEPERKRRRPRLREDVPSVRTVVPGIDHCRRPAPGGGGVAKQAAA